MKNFKDRLPSWLTVLSAALLVLAFPPWDLTFLLWIGLVPWFIALSKADSFKKNLKEGLWMGFFFSFLGFYWVAYVLQKFAHLPWPVAILGLLIFSVFSQPQFFLFSFIFKALKKNFLKNNSVLFFFVTIGTLASAYTFIDWCIPKLFVDTLGHGFYSYPHLRQIADLTGVAGLTFLVVLHNSAIFCAFLAIARSSSKTQHREAWAVGYLSVLLLIGVVWTYGYFRYKQFDQLAKNAEFRRFSVIQANIGDFEKVAAESGFYEGARKIVSTYINLSLASLKLKPKPEFVVWPETSYPSSFRRPVSNRELLRDKRVENYVRETQTPLFFGGYDTKAGADYNAFFFLYPWIRKDLPGDGDLQTYYKSILLLFGEYIPFYDNSTFLQRMFPQVGNFGRGEGPTVFRVEGQEKKELNIIPAICYEVLYSNYIIEAARKGGEMVLNITNDSWFGPIAEPQLHLALATFRGVETRIPLLRSTNTGISALISINGDILGPSEIGHQGALIYDVPIVKPPRTLIMILGNWFGPLTAVLSLGFTFLYFRFPTV